MKVKGVVPFLWVTSMERSLRYYIDGLGFKMENQWVVDGKVRWCWLGLGGSAIMLQEFAKATVPQEKLGIGMSLNFTTLSDPDGYRLHFASPTDTPEETKLSEVRG
jgi:lactoylglutathione lyase